MNDYNNRPSIQIEINNKSSSNLALLQSKKLIYQDGSKFKSDLTVVERYVNFITSLEVRAGEDKKYHNAKMRLCTEQDF